MIQWWPWWISSLAGVTLAGAATVAHLRSAGLRRTVATVAVVLGLAVAAAAPVVMTGSGDDLRMERDGPAMP